MAERRRIETKDIESGITIVRLVDRKILDEQNIQFIGEQLFALVREQSKKRIILNLEDVEYLSSMALGKFITLRNVVESVNGKLVFCSIKPEIMGDLEQTGLDKKFHIKKDLTGAIGAFE